MDLVLDIGNSRTKAALFRDGALLRTGSMANRDTAALGAFLGDAQPGHIVLGSVAEEDEGLMAHLRGMAPLLVVTGASPAPVRTMYADPSALGADRLANAVAAALRFPHRPVLAIDLGTCITYDLVEAGGIHAGGAISPGMRMRAKAMDAYSARLPEAAPGDAPREVGTSTMASLEAGVHHGVLNEMRGFIGRYGATRPGMAVVLTGGDAPRFAKALESGIFAHPFLTLEGLHAILTHPRAVAGHPPAPAGAARDHGRAGTTAG